MRTERHGGHVTGSWTVEIDSAAALWVGVFDSLLIRMIE
jgi:hypothetical protein